MKVAELTGALLDYWVARAEGICLHDAPHTKECGNWGADYTCTRCKKDASSRPNVGSWHPSTDWAQGGPIIGRERIQLSAPPSGEWVGIMYVKGKLIAPEADKPLVAAMRAYVASKFGDEVPDEIAHP